MNFEGNGRMQRFAYDKWMLIEQDTHLLAPGIYLKISADVLNAIFS